MKKSKQIVVPDCDNTEYEVTPDATRITTEEALVDYCEIVTALEATVQELSKALTPVLIGQEKTPVLPKLQNYIASSQCKEILALNSLLMKIQLTIHNLTKNLGV